MPTSSWYEFVARDGFAAIRKADSEGNLEVLTRTQVVRSFLFFDRLEAACMDDADGNAELAMHIDGRRC